MTVTNPASVEPTARRGRPPAAGLLDLLSASIRSGNQPSWHQSARGSLLHFHATSQ